MSAIRYCGAIRIRLTYLEPYLAGDAPPAGRSTNSNGEYRCFLRGPNGLRETIYVGAPACLSFAVDSSEAFDAAARASLSFAHNDSPEWESHAAWKDDAGWDVVRQSELG